MANYTCKDINGNEVMQYELHEDGVVYAVDTNENTINLTSECCVARGFEYDSYKGVCLYRDVCDEDERVKVVFNVDNYNGLMFNKADNEICELQLNFNFLVEYDSNTLNEYSQSENKSISETVQGLELRLLIEKVDNNTLTPIYEQPLYNPNALGITTGIILRGDSVGLVNNKLQSEMGLEYDPSVLDSQWLSTNITIDDETLIEQIENEEVKFSIVVEESLCDFAIIMDNIELNKVCRREYIERRTIDEAPSLNLEKTIDNKKSWIETLSDREYDLPIRETSYETNSEKLVVNSKEIELSTSIFNAIEQDIVGYIQENNEMVTGKNINDVLWDNDLTKLLSTDISTLKSVTDILRAIGTELIDVKSRQTLNGYPVLSLIHERYMASEDSNKYDFARLNDFVEMLGNYWVDLIEQVIPATTLWGSTNRIGTTLFRPNKFRYRKYNLYVGSNNPNENVHPTNKEGFTQNAGTVIVTNVGDDNPTKDTYNDVYITKFSNNSERTNMVTVIDEKIAPVMGNLRLLGYDIRYADIEWDKATDNAEVYLYELWVKYPNSSKFVKTRSFLPNEQRSFRQTGLEPYSTYSFYILSLDEAGNSDKSNTVTFTTLDTELFMTPSVKPLEQPSGTFTIEVESNTDWTITEQPDWLTIGAVEETGNKTLEISYEKNMDLTEREGWIKIQTDGSGTKYAECKMVQEPFVPTLEVIPTTINLGRTEESYSLEVKSNTSWAVSLQTDDGDWIGVGGPIGTENITGFGDGFVDLTSSVNMLEGRSAQIKVENTRGVLYEIVTVNQAGDTAAPDMGTISMTGKGLYHINLEWGVATDNVGVTYYELWGKGPDDSIFAKLGTYSPSDSRNYEHTGLEPNSEHEYYVYAYDAVGNRGKSNVLKVTTIDTHISIVPSTLTVERVSGEFEVEVTSNVDWRVITSGVDYPDWVNIGDVIHTGNKTITFTYGKNDDLTSRGGIITFKTDGSHSKTVTLDLTQKPFVPTLVVEPTTVNLSRTSDSENIEITSNTTWSVSVLSGGDWLDYDTNDISGSGDDTFDVSAVANNGESRTGKIKISTNVGNLEQIITFNQAGDDISPVMGDISVTGKGTNYIDLEWDIATDNIGVTSYELWGKPASSGTYQKLKTFTPTASRNHRHSGLNTDTSYQYYIMVYDGAGHFDKSNTVSGRTLLIPELSMAITERNFPYEGYNGAIFYVSSNTEWVVTLDGEEYPWIEILDNSDTGSGDGQVKVKILANNGVFRSGEFVVATKNLSTNHGTESITVSITQDKVQSTLTVAPLEPKLAAEGGSFTVTVTSNTTWEVVESVSWARIGGASGSEDDTFSVNYDPNTGSTSRDNEEIIVRTLDGEHSKTIILNQPAAAPACTNQKANHTFAMPEEYEGLGLGNTCSESLGGGIRTRNFRLVGFEHGMFEEFVEDPAGSGYPGTIGGGPGGDNTLSCGQEFAGIGNTVSSFVYNGSTITPGAGQEIRLVRSDYDIEGADYDVYVVWNGAGHEYATVADVYLVCSNGDGGSGGDGGSDGPGGGGTNPEPDTWTSVSVGVDSSSSGACSIYSNGHRELFYVNGSFNGASKIAQNGSGTGLVSPGWYSNGQRSRYWDGQSFTTNHYC